MSSLEFLRIDSESYSRALGEQIFTENIYLIEHFKNKVYPEIVKRQFSKYGYLGPRKRVSIHLGSLLTLYVFSMLARPKSITEVGTFSGSSGLALAASFLDPAEQYSFYTCDTNECDKTFINSLNLNATVDLEIFRESSMMMFQKWYSRNHKIDLLHLDGFLHPN